MDYLEDLNPQQYEGVINTEGPCMIIAGAGSGKTRVLTYRIAHLIRSCNAEPFNILSLTFTNKAAGEMRDRIGQVVGPEAKNIWMGTFHSIFARILRIESDRLGYPNNFSIYDADDSKSLLRNIIKELNLDDKVYKPNTVLGRISAAKNRLISADQYIANNDIRIDDEAARRPELGRIYKIYTERCFRSGAMDFDDLLFNTNVLFKLHLDVLNKYQQRFHYIMVDEFQDTNVSQYLIIKKLAAVRQNICVVGDDAQSIYAFRGADIQNILNFEKDYPELKVIKLEQNYRSTQNIVNLANTIIKNNQAQLPKNVWTSNGVGDLIELIKATSDNEEGNLVASAIFEEKQQKQLRYRDFAVLYRTNSQSRAIEEALRRRNIKYRIIGGLSFYQRKEIKDLLAYLKFTVNPNDEESLRRIINYPKRGIGPTTFNKLVVAANDNNISLWQALQNGKNLFGGRTGNALESFVAAIRSFQVEADKKDAYETAFYIAKLSGLLKELHEDKSIEGLSRYENVQELLNAIKEFVDNPDAEDRSLGAFLQEVSLITSVDAAGDDDGDHVTLMTIHMAKGLEFKVVHLVGLEEDLFPSQMMLTSRADLEEERRLFYVAVTRAERKLSLSYALTRYRFGRLKNCEPSRFIDELDPSLINFANKISKSDTTTGAGYVRNLIEKKPKQRESNYVHVPTKDFQPSDISQLSEGMKVEHPKFGFGKVTKMDNVGSSKKAKVEFENFGEKTLLLSFAKLKIHD